MRRTLWIRCAEAVGATARANPTTTPPPGPGTVDEEEIRKFRALAQRWWDPKGPLAMLHQMNPTRVHYIQSVVGDIRGKTILDIGCGGGILSTSLCRLGAQVTGIDACPESIAAAQQHQSRHHDLASIQFRCERIESHKGSVEEGYDGLRSKEGRKEGYDVVVMSEVLEHVPTTHIDAFLDAAVKNVRTDGAVVITTINKTLLSRLFVVNVAEYMLGIVPPGTHDYEKFLAPEYLTGVLKQKGLVTTDVRGIVVFPHLFPEPCLSFALFPAFTEMNYCLAAVKNR